MSNTSESRRLCLTRLYRFSASHRLRSPYLNDEENRRTYGKCGNPSGHGHNYVLRVTVKGAPDPATGMIIDVSRLDEIVAREVLIPFDHRDLNEVLEGVKILTSETLIGEIWRRLAPHLPLERIEVDETRKNGFRYCGGEDK